jgi:phosphotransferase system enzyme I (PtsP)
VNLEDAELHPNFQLLPDIGEEPFHAFLGVPIIHQRQVLGVLVVQQARRRRFDESEEAFLVTMSAQLAGVIAHALVTGDVPTRKTPSASGSRRASAVCPGRPGIGIGTAVVMSPVADLYAVPRSAAVTGAPSCAPSSGPWRRCASISSRSPTSLRDKLSPEDLALFDVYLGILDDSTIGGEVAAQIKAGQWAQGALAAGDDRAHPPLRGHGALLSARARRRREGPRRARARLPAGGAA